MYFSRRRKRVSNLEVSHDIRTTTGRSYHADRWHVYSTTLSSLFAVSLLALFNIFHEYTSPSWLQSSYDISLNLDEDSSCTCSEGFIWCRRRRSCVSISEKDSCLHSDILDKLPQDGATVATSPGKVRKRVHSISSYKDGSLGKRTARVHEQTESLTEQVITLGGSKINHELETPRHMAFIAVGAIRTLDQTYESVLRNMALPLCSPPHCVSHLITHFSFMDNRPDRRSNDPRGQVVIPLHSNRTSLEVSMRRRLCGGSETDDSDVTFGALPHRFSFCYTVEPSYDIGSKAESEAMDQYENQRFNGSVNNDYDILLLRRLGLLRLGDPRRYSMWFARHYAWRFVRESVEKILDDQGQKFDSYFFFRPDLLWFIPLPTLKYFHEFHVTDPNEIWVHDRYFFETPDTFAYLPNSYVADAYFSLEFLVQPGIACLGGPAFDKALVRQRLEDFGFDRIDRSDWCHENPDSDSHGISEQILFRKLLGQGITTRHLPAGVAILRPGNHLNCQLTEKQYVLPGCVVPEPSEVEPLSCRALGYRIHSNVSVDTQYMHDWRPVRIRQGTDCLTNTSGELILSTCRDPIPQTQLFESNTTIESLKHKVEFSSAELIREKAEIYPPSVIYQRPL